MSARAGKRPMRSLTAHEKLEAIRRVHDGESKASVARDIGVPESTLRGWCKNEDKISYLSRQSSPETDESLESQSKKPRLDDSAMQPFNLSLKNNNGTFSPNSETRYAATEPAIKPEQESAKVPLNLNTKTETPKATSEHLTERERNRAELARMSVELGLNRPEMFLSSLQSTSNLSDLSANINILAHWNTMLLQQQQKMQQTSKSKIGGNTDANVSTSGLLTTVDQEKQMKHLPREQQSVNDSIWYWLKNQQTKISQAALPVMQQHANGSVTSTTTPSTTVNANVTTLNGLNGVSMDQTSWFWNWYKKLAYGQQMTQQVPTPDKPILYQRLTKEPPQNPQKESCPPQDQQNAENLSMHGDKSSNNKTINNNNASSNSNKVRSVLDNLLFNNNNNVAVNTKKDNGKEDEELVSQREAVEHGEKFLKWLETCSDPSVTAMQIMQFKFLLNNVKSVAERKNGDTQNKTKVKRK